MKKILIILLIFIVLAILPLIFKDKGHTTLDGPDLSEMPYTEITFRNDAASINLAGMLFLPKTSAPYPLAVIIHGSGPSKRNSVWYLSVTKHLQENGIAVLLPDKRGCEKSEGEWVGADFENLATDTKSAVEYIAELNDSSFSKIGIIGMSQGGWIAPIVAANSKDVSFAVSMSGSTVTTDEQLLHEEINNIAPYTYTFIAKLIAPLTCRNIKKTKTFAPLAGFDPIPYWKKVTQPVFMAFGGNDQNVPVEECLKRLNESDLKHFKTQTYPDGGHGIIDKDLHMINRDFISDLVNFIKHNQ